MAWHHRGSYYETGDGYFAFPNIKEKSSLKLSVIVPAYNEEERCKFVDHLALCGMMEM